MAAWRSGAAPCRRQHRPDDARACGLRLCIGATDASRALKDNVADARFDGLHMLLLLCANQDMQSF
jgi:hypothetical protein